MYALSLCICDTCEYMYPLHSVDKGLFMHTENKDWFFNVLTIWDLYLRKKTNNTINNHLLYGSCHIALIVRTCLHGFFFPLPKLGSKHDLCITFGWYVEPTFLISSFHKLKSSPNWSEPALSS